MNKTRLIEFAAYAGVAAILGGFIYWRHTQQPAPNVADEINPQGAAPDISVVTAALDLENQEENSLINDPYNSDAGGIGASYDSTDYLPLNSESDILFSNTDLQGTTSDTSDTSATTLSGEETAIGDNILAPTEAPVEAPATPNSTGSIYEGDDPQLTDAFYEPAAQTNSSPAGESVPDTTSSASVLFAPPPVVTLAPTVAPAASPSASVNTSGLSNVPVPQVPDVAITTPSGAVVNVSAADVTTETVGGQNYDLVSGYAGTAADEANEAYDAAVVAAQTSALEKAFANSPPVATPGPQGKAA